MAANVVKVPQQAWFDDSELTFEFPAAWDVRVHHMKGYDLPPLGPEAIRRALANPLAARPIREIAKGKKEVALIFDDMSRPTKIAELVPYLLEELAAAGISDDHIRFICALGTHGALTRVDFAKKLGNDIPGRFPVYNHNPYELCTQVGTTSSGTPVYVNDEVLRCDLRIGIGCILPHPLSGWGGGAKIVLPGICGVETIVHNHQQTTKLLKEGKYDLLPIIGKYEGNPLRLDMEEAARLAGLDLVVDALVNERRDTVDLLVGDHVAVLAEGVRRGREIYATEAADETYDIVVANAYAKSNEATLAARRASTWGSKEIEVVIVTSSPEGQVPHYLLGTFGNEIGGRLWGMPKGLPKGVRRMLVYSEYPERAASHWLGHPSKVEWFESWGRIVEELQAAHPAGAKVAVFPDLTIQYFPSLIR